MNQDILYNWHAELTGTGSKSIVLTTEVFLWSPYGIGQTIIFSPCFFLSFFSSSNLSGRRLGVYHTSTDAVALCTAVKQWASAKLCGVEQRAPLMFGSATITLGLAHILVSVRFSMYDLDDEVIWPGSIRSALCYVTLCYNLQRNNVRRQRSYTTSSRTWDRFPSAANLHHDTDTGNFTNRNATPTPSPYYGRPTE